MALQAEYLYYKEKDVEKQREKKLANYVKGIKNCDTTSYP